MCNIYQNKADKVVKVLQSFFIYEIKMVEVQK